MPHLMHPDRFVHRHIGPRDDDQREMLALLDCESLDDLVAKALPGSILTKHPLALHPPLTEVEAMEELSRMAGMNRVLRSYIGRGFHGTVLPAVIRRNVLENPGWYTQYTPYQAEIAQGRLEALLNFQTLVASLTGLDVANASLLDEATAAAEAMTLCARALDRGAEGRCFLASDRCHPETLAVLATRAEPLGIEIVVGDPLAWDFARPAFGVLLPYPTTDGEVLDLAGVVRRAHDAGALVVVAADLLALTLFREPGAWGADVAIGSAQRFGVPLGSAGRTPPTWRSRTR
jgi:glycine dehydrogenase